MEGSHISAQLEITPGFNLSDDQLTGFLILSADHDCEINHYEILLEELFPVQWKSEEPEIKVFELGKTEDSTPILLSAGEPLRIPFSFSFRLRNRQSSAFPAGDADMVGKRIQWIKKYLAQQTSDFRLVARVSAAQAKEIIEAISSL